MINEEIVTLRARKLNMEFYEYRIKSMTGMNEDFELLAAFIFIKIAALEIENENLRRDIIGLL